MRNRRGKTQARFPYAAPWGCRWRPRRCVPHPRYVSDAVTSERVGEKTAELTRWLTSARSLAGSATLQICASVVGSSETRAAGKRDGFTTSFGPENDFFATVRVGVRGIAASRTNGIRMAQVTARGEASSTPSTALPADAGERRGERARLRSRVVALQLRDRQRAERSPATRRANHDDRRRKPARLRASPPYQMIDECEQRLGSFAPTAARSQLSEIGSRCNSGDFSGPRPSQMMLTLDQRPRLDVASIAGELQTRASTV